MINNSTLTEQDKTEVCEAATKLNNPKRGMLTPTTEYIHDQLKVTSLNNLVVTWLLSDLVPGY